VDSRRAELGRRRRPARALALLVGARASGVAAFAALGLLTTPASAQPAAAPAKPAAPPAATPARPAAPARAQEVLGTVLALDGEELILDLGADQGAVQGAVVELWRPLKLKHPVSGKVITDRFLIGELRLGQVRKAMTLATPEGALRRAPERGDVVIMTRAPAPLEPASGQPDAAPPAGAPGHPQTGDESEAHAIGRMMESLQGADLPTRIRRYEDYVRAQPNGRYARVLYEEAAALRRLLADEHAPGKTPRASAAERPALRNHRRPDEAVAGTALRVGIEVSDATAGAVLHVRQAGEPAYQSMPMTEAGAGYFVATIPAERMAAPAMEYFIEATSPDGRAHPLVAAAATPARIEVHPAARPAPPDRVDATAVLLTDYADYNRLRGNDRAWQTEGYFGLRYGDTGVRAVRTGFGVYRGVGGSIRELDELGRRGREVGLTYGYLEGEFGLSRSFSIGARLALGLIHDGVSSGGQLLLRIGSDQGTNLLLGGEILGGVGMRSITQLEWSSIERVPIMLRTEVTNQPAGTTASFTQVGGEGVAMGTAEVGVRGIVQVGYKLLPSLVVAARGSFQGRTIRHGGPGFGAAVGYTW